MINTVKEVVVMNRNSVFINLTNHTSTGWSEAQREEALRYGKIIDIPFPVVPPTADSKQVEAMAFELVEEVMRENPRAVCCQGEMALTYKVVSLLKSHGIPVLAATSARDIVEKKMPGGATQKTAIFRFCMFREY